MINKIDEKTIEINSTGIVLEVYSRTCCGDMGHVVFVKYWPGNTSVRHNKTEGWQSKNSQEEAIEKAKKWIENELK